MEVEAKLDEDFFFYLGFTNTFAKRLKDPEVYRKSRLWLCKLCGEPCEGIYRKRCRNMYLAQLVLGMQNGVLDKPFLQPPHDVDIIDAYDVFAPIPKDIETPDWLNDTPYHVRDDLEDIKDKSGRTYVATRTLPKGQGAVAYIGVSLTDKEPIWYKPGDKERILAKRKDPSQREKVLTFYDVLLHNIADELDGKDTPEDETVEGLLVQLVHDLINKNQYKRFEELNNAERRTKLLLLLFDRVKARRDKVAVREKILDEIEQGIPHSNLNVAMSEPNDTYHLPSAMWEQAVDMLPSKKRLEKLMETYPLDVTKKFVKCLSNEKEKIAMRVQRRHENIYTQMKREVRKEGEKKRKMVEDAEQAMDNALTVLNAVRDHYKVLIDMERRAKAGYVPNLENKKLYDQMKAAISEQQKIVEDEAQRGKSLAAQINEVCDNTERMMRINENLINTAEEANKKTMRNIQRLANAVKTYENRLCSIRDTIKTMKRGGRATSFVV